MDTTVPILVVDDDPIFLAVTEEIVAALGYQNVESAGSAAMGIARLKEAGHFGLIILDLNMPGLDGLAFLRQASEAGFTGNVIISSGETEAVLRTAEQMGRMLKVNVLGALKKPLSPEKLAVLLARDETTEPAFQRPSPLPGSLADLELVPFYQAQHDAFSGAIVGLEALIRARGPDGQIYGPGKLFGMIQAREQLVSTTLAITKAVLGDVTNWAVSGQLRRTAINLDTSLIEDPVVVASLVSAVSEAGINPSSVCWELTETTLPKDMTRLMEGLGRLRMAGFHVSLDDYGTGGSNFEILRLCPFTELKIDGTLLRSASEEPVTQRFIASAVGMARDLDLDIVGEGVESRSQCDLARQLGIPVIQGFWFSRPMPVEDMSQLLSGKRYVLVAR